MAAHKTDAGSRLVYACCLAASLVILGVAGAQLLGPLAPRQLRRCRSACPGRRPLPRRCVTSFFQIVINLGAAAASLFALGYGQHEEAPGRVLPFYPAFLAGMNLVLLADDAFTLPGRLGVHVAVVLGAGAGTPSRQGEHGGPATSTSDGELRHAGAAAGVRPAGRPRRQLRLQRDPRRAEADWLPGLVLGLVLVGAGSKAGLVPLHVWLPLAHPAAPSHVSALMSGVMTKVAVYGFIRIVFDLLGPPEWWWSIVVLALGG